MHVKAAALAVVIRPNPSKAYLVVTPALVLDANVPRGLAADSRHGSRPAYFLRVRAARAIRMAEASAIPDRNVMATSVGAVA